MPTHRRPVYFNPSARTWKSPPPSAPELIDRFHKQLPQYNPTNLVTLDAVAKDIGVRAVYLKDESNRFGLPSFKILGASWGTFRAVARELDLSLDTSLETIKEAAAARRIKLYAATDGNHGRAVAFMGTILKLLVEVHVPAGMDPVTAELIESEGATIVHSSGNYDDAVSEAADASKCKGGILIQDFAFEGYEDIPQVGFPPVQAISNEGPTGFSSQWVVDGYLTMMREIDEQLKNEHIDLVIAPVGVGSFAQAVVSHFKRQGSTTTVLTVEPDTAACLWTSLGRGKLTKVSTTPTIMAGLDCGTPSTIAWPLLQSGVDASLTISDYEAHEAALYLKTKGVSAGPCGASPLAALRRLSEEDKATLGLSQDSVIVLLSTEGERNYKPPLSVSIEDPILLTQTFVQINSASPTLGSVPGPGETEMARYIASWLAHRDIETHWLEPTKGRPSIIGVARGTGGGKTLMFNGHLDTVTLQGYDGDALSGHITDGKLYGRGSADMKSGLAAALVALAEAKKLGLRGDVIFTGVADEEDKSLGTEQLLRVGWRADAALVIEPTGLEILHAHKGFVWLDVTIHGLAAHGSLPEIGIDAISKAGYFLVELDRYAKRLQERTPDPTVGLPSVHASIIKGGEEESSYPALCTISLERRTVPGETPESVKAEIQASLDKLVEEVADFRYDIEVMFSRPSFQLPLDDPFTVLVRDIVSKSLGREASVQGAPFWTDCALLTAEGIPALLWGPRGEGFHGKEEWVAVESVRLVSETLTAVAVQFCR
ncbi:hypothetical protein G7046_g4086 [Stylonectria norvegica]|nr:hypothetical protein G7046_g4086 [Stylonectria norvegica]